MPRKIFLSVLGSSAYKECVYVCESTHYRSEPVRFVQEATLKCNPANWADPDRIFIFLTRGDQGSRRKNWEDNGHPGKQDPCEGLKSRLDRMGLLPIVRDIDIPDGNTEKEIWEIFRVIFSCIENGDEIHFDITHGFRFMPMLVLVLSNYSRFLKDSRIVSITYGNFEGRNIESNESPILDLAPLAELQDWTQAASEFIALGKTFSLSKLVKNTGKKQEKKSIHYFSLANALDQLEGDFYTVRGRSIVEGIPFGKVRISIENMKSLNPYGPLEPILNKVKEKTESFSTEPDLRNGFEAVEWCRRHKLIQQAATLGQEIILTWLMERFELQEFNRDDRQFMGSVIGISQTKSERDESLWNTNLLARYELTKELFGQAVIQNLAKPYHQLTDIRNTMNHGGFTNPIEFRQFEKQFNEYWNKCLTILKDHGLEFVSALQ